MEQSILKSTKKLLNIAEDDDSFDLDVMIHINTAFSTLNDLGVGPELGFVIDSDEEEWPDFISDDDENVVQVNRVKSFVGIHTRLAFDPPATSYHLNALQEQLKELGWRLNVKREETEWVDPDPEEVVEVEG